MTEPVIITHLEMHASPEGPAPRFPEGVSIVRAVRPTVGFYRFLYDAVGRDWDWVDRKKLSDEALAAIIQDERVAVHVLYVEGTPAGYAELDARVPGEVQIAYFGLMPEFIGQGLGTRFLEWAIRQAWAMAPRRVHVNTCTLDHPGALPLYQKLGFRPFKTEVREH